MLAYGSISHNQPSPSGKLIWLHEVPFNSMGPPRGGFSTGSNSTPTTANPYAGSRTPSWGAQGRTPNPYADGRTPAWNASSATPNPYAAGGKTPAWNVSSRTPNPYAQGGQTPAWNAQARTPNPYSSGGGSGGWGGATPKPSGGWGDNGGSWGGSSPAWGQASGGQVSRLCSQIILLSLTRHLCMNARMPLHQLLGHLRLL